MDEFIHLERLGLGSRLKRISDYIFSEINAFYKENGIDFEASCFPLLSIIHTFGPISLRGAERKLGVTHAAISQKAKVLHKHGLITMRTDRNDQRSKLLKITEKGEKLVEITQPCWEAMERAMAHMLYPEEGALFRALLHFEEQIRSRSLRSRIYENFSPGPLKGITITGYGIGMKPHFKRLNEHHLGKLFSFEAVDEDFLENPRQTIIDKGGDILFAEYEGQIIGTCALLKDNNHFALANISVDPRFLGRDVDQQLLQAAISKAREKGAQTVYLLSGSKLPADLQRYFSMGFKEAPVNEEDISKFKQVETRLVYSLK